MAPDTDEQLARLAEAAEAVKRVKELCAAAGISVDVRWASGDALDLVAEAIKEAAASAERRRPVVSIGDTVQVSNGRGGWGPGRLDAAAVKWITVSGVRYARAGGGREKYSSYRIHPDDLHRINRDLPPKRGGR